MCINLQMHLLANNNENKTLTIKTRFTLLHVWLVCMDAKLCLAPCCWPSCNCLLFEIQEPNIEICMFSIQKAFEFFWNLCSSFNANEDGSMNSISVCLFGLSEVHIVGDKFSVSLVSSLSSILCVLSFSLKNQSVNC